MKRRSIKTCVSIFLLILCNHIMNAQTIGTFQSVQPTPQTQNLVLPSSHTFQKIIQTGNLLSSGEVMGPFLDFTGYVPISGSSENGYLSISSEFVPAECAILTIALNRNQQLWKIKSGGKVFFPPNDLGSVALFCSGTVTPKNTVMVCEETTEGTDLNLDGYQDNGWVIEIDPATRKVINQDGAGGVDKLWSIGRQKHENVTIKKDQTIMYWGADANPTGFLYKFIPAAPGNFSNGSLYVLKTTPELGSGTWELINNVTQADRNNTVALSVAAGAYNFDGIEDVEIGPDGKIYFAAKGPGRIYRFTDQGTTVALEVFVESTSYDVDGDGPYAPEQWGNGNDNLAFDGEGNLWVLQDGGRNHIWVVGPTHTAATPAVRLFATTPMGSEPTGITFSPDYKYLFLSFQHPSQTNATPQMDAAGQPVIFNNHTTVVIARKEFLGSPIVHKPRNAFIKLYPLPVLNSELHIDFPSEKNSIITLSIINEAGVVFHTTKKTVHEGLNTFTINPRQLVTGNYIVRITDGKKAFHKRFTKL